ncbi:uncharacterized protein LOC120353097 [Nilaparvata lugens]|uniref:uncharacterized protein LOC120353097 n=1 Tax=Nilaparvata lugens TaxID=108931 RepID=UPI00193CEAFE|nr:uncharacterized protein LOC120353097 [Nilaparvata lugens]
MGNYKASAMIVKSKSGELKCIECNNSHELENCEVFLNLKPSDRLKRVKEWKLCIGCLLAGHFIRDCRRRKPCSHCNSRHHSLLHLEPRQPPVENTNTLAGNKQMSRVDVHDVADQSHQTFVTDSAKKVFSNVNSSSVLLPTVKLGVRGNQGNYHKVKVLLDSASTESFITRRCMKKLGLVVQKTHSLPIYGLSDTKLEVTDEITNCEFEIPNSPSLKITVSGVNKIAATNQIKNAYWAHIEGLELADSEFFLSEEVDILLGAEYFPFILTGRKVIGPAGTPSALETVWGYCLMGKVSEESSTISNNLCMYSNANSEELVKRFWVVEEPPRTKKLLESEMACEEIYKSTVCRLNTGRYIVELPSKETNTREISGYLEVKTNVGENVTMIREEELGDNLEEVPGKQGIAFNSYLPINGNLGKELKVIHSPHEIKPMGRPILKKEIGEDVFEREKRNLEELDDDRQDNVEIKWTKSEKGEEMKEYTLTTMSYGVSSSPFLAICTTHQCIEVQKVLSKIINIDYIAAWTYSTVAVSWIQSSPHRWARFVANRVSQVQEHLSTEQFRYVSTECNPADCASRGLFLNELIGNSLWWNGSDWLDKPLECWPHQTHGNDDENSIQIELEARKITLATQSKDSEESIQSVKLRNRWSLLKRIVSSFWKRWQLEYVSSLQTRTKWYRKHSNVNIGRMALLKESNLLPLHWRLGRITKIFLEQDGIVRVVEVQTAKGSLTSLSIGYVSSLLMKIRPY